MTLLKSISKLSANRSVAAGVVLSTTLSLPASWAVAAVPQHGAQNGDQRALVVKEFQDRVNTYMTLRKKLASAVPPLKPTPEPEKIEAGKNSLSIAIRGARRDAKPGDIFSSAAELFRQSIREDSKNRSARDVSAALEEVPKYGPPAVNAEYPSKAPVATVPPLLLGEFPELPEPLEYRFMGRSLILYDAKANLIVDFIREAVPRKVKK